MINQEFLTLIIKIIIIMVIVSIIIKANLYKIMLKKTQSLGKKD